MPLPAGNYLSPCETIEPPHAGASRARGPFLLRFVTFTAALLSLSCNEVVLVRWATTVYGDGSLQRRLEVTARDPNAAAPAGAAWIEDDLKLHVADPNSWSHIEHSPGLLLAEGFFQSVAAVPRTLAHSTDTGLHPDRMKTSLHVQDLVVIRRWDYRETYGDPFGSEDIESSMDALTEMARRFLHEGIRSEFGEGVHPMPADGFLATELRPLVSDLLAAGMLSPLDPRPLDADSVPWRAVLTRRGIPCAKGEDPMDPEPAIAALLGWSRRRLAVKLSTPRRAIHPEDLSFLSEDGAARIVDRLWGDRETLETMIGARLEAIQGYYSSAAIPGFTFESNVELPGLVVRTNGTPDGGSILWLFRGEDLRQGDRAMEATSVVVDDAKLRDLGARREFDPASLLRLLDILETRDADGRLASLLARAVAGGGLSLLKSAPLKRPGEKAEPEAPGVWREELVRLLDPNVSTTSP